MLECVVGFGPGVIIGDVELNAAAHVLERRKARLAHHSLEQHAPRYRDAHRRRLELLGGLRVMRLVQLRGKRVAAEIVRVRVPFCA